MNFLLDVHLPISLSKFLDNKPECTAVHVNRLLQKWNTTDNEICRYADENNLVVITKDEDFKNSHFVKKTPKKIVRITLGNIGNSELILVFDKYLPFILSAVQKNSFYIEVNRDQLLIIE